MLYNVVYGVLSVITWTAFGYKVKDLVHNWRNLELSMLCLAIATFAAPFFFASPAVYVRVDALLSSPNIATLIIYTSVAICLSCFIGLLVSWSSSQSRIRLHHWLLIGYAIATVVGMIILFALGNVSDAEHPVDFDVHYGHSRGTITSFLFIYQILFSVAMVGLVRLCWRYSKLVAEGRAWLSRGLRLVTIGALFGLGYSLPKVASLLWELASPSPTSPLDYANSVIAPMSAAVSAALFAVGFTMPAWGQGLASIVRWSRDFHSYQQRYRLWSDLVREFPNIVLYPSRMSRWVARDLRFLCNRQVTEIRDAELALSYYFDPNVARIARELGQAKGVAGNDLQAVIEAAQVAAALEARAAGRRTGSQQVSAPYDPAGGNLVKEAHWLATIGIAFRKSPIVREAVDQTEQFRGSVQA